MNAPSKEEVDAKIEVLAARMETRLVSIESRIDTQFAALKAELHKSNADTIKWVAGIVGSTMVLGLTIMTFVLNNALPKAPAAPPTQLVFPLQVPSQGNIAPQAGSFPQSPVKPPAPQAR
jgi:hypothetical protein